MTSFDEIGPGLRAALKDAGVSRMDWDQVEQAKALIATVNRRLQRKGSAVRYNVGFSMDPSRERRPRPVSEDPR